MSPAATSPAFAPRPERPLSTNPFIDNTEALSFQSARQSLVPVVPSTTRPDFTNQARELFVCSSVVIFFFFSFWAPLLDDTRHLTCPLIE